MIRNTNTPRIGIHTGPRYGTRLAIESTRLAAPLRPTRSITMHAREELYYADRESQRDLEKVRHLLIAR